MTRGRTSAGMVLVRRTAAGVLEVLLGHPGGPFWAQKDEGAWSIPKGLVEDGEDELAAALREVAEELGIAPPPPPYVPLGDVRMKSGKRVVAWGARADVDVAKIRSNEIPIEWPPRSGKTLMVPELDRAAWADLDRARVLANAAQVPLLERACSPDVVRALFSSAIDG